MVDFKRFTNMIMIFLLLLFAQQIIVALTWLDYSSVLPVIVACYLVHGIHQISKTMYKHFGEETLIGKIYKFIFVKDKDFLV